MNTLSVPVVSGVRGTFASAPDLNLTLFSDGENHPKLIDSLGRVFPCGITAPTEAPTITDTATGTFTNAVYCCYRYCYATTKVALAESEVAAGGEIWPRSNPSPRSAGYKPASNARKLVATVNYSQESLVDKILIYRTDFFDTAALAETAADAGQLTWVGTIPNYNVVGTTQFTETDPVVGGEDLVIDNYVAPIFRHVCYVEPYFYAGGNDDFLAEVSITYTGLVTITDDSVWREGRNGQFAKFDGIDSGGVDASGSYYFKRLSDTTAQVYSDATLATVASLPMQGDTRIRIFGNANILYRSKARNPLAWGTTDVVDDVNVPKVFNIRVGGGHITAISQLNGANLLKVDTVNPTASYTFNLRAQDTTDFAATRKASAGSLSSISAYAQVEVQLTQAGISTLAFDANSNKIFLTDGTNVEDVSDAVTKTLANTSDDVVKRGLISAIYNRDTDLALFFLPQKAGDTEPSCFFSTALGFHAGLKQWYAFLLPDITASANIEDSVSGRRFTVVGSEKGKIGILFDSDESKYSFNWIPKTSAGYNIVDRYPMTLTTGGSFNFSIDALSLEDAEIEEWVGMWGVLTSKFNATDTGYYARYLVRVGSWVGVNDITFDLAYDFATGEFASDLQGLQSLNQSERTGLLWMGCNPVAITKSFVAERDSLKAAQFWVNYDAPTVTGYATYAFGTDIAHCSVEVNRGFQGAKDATFTNVVALTRDESQNFAFQNSYNNRAYVKELFPVDTLHGFMLTFSQFGYVRHTYFDLKFTK